jgi:hypothetical protein
MLPGAKADETPRRFIWGKRTFELGEVLNRWYQVESKPEWPRADYFKLWAADEREYLLKHDLESDEWFLGSAYFDLSTSASSGKDLVNRVLSLSLRRQMGAEEPVPVRS